MQKHNKLFDKKEQITERETKPWPQGCNVNANMNTHNASI